MIDSFGSDSDILGEAKHNMLLYIYLGVATFFVASIMYSGWMIAGERQAVKCREEYFKSLMKQEVGWFDTQKQA